MKKISNIIIQNFIDDPIDNSIKIPLKDIQASKCKCCGRSKYDCLKHLYL